MRLNSNMFASVVVALVCGTGVASSLAESPAPSKHSTADRAMNLRLVSLQDEQVEETTITETITVSDESS